MWGPVIETLVSDFLIDELALPLFGEIFLLMQMKCEQMRFDERKRIFWGLAKIFQRQVDWRTGA